MSHVLAPYCCTNKIGHRMWKQIFAFTIYNLCRMGADISWTSSLASGSMARLSSHQQEWELANLTMTGYKPHPAFQFQPQYNFSIMSFFPNTLYNLWHTLYHNISYYTTLAEQEGCQLVTTCNYFVSGYMAYDCMTKSPGIMTALEEVQLFLIGHMDSTVFMPSTVAALSCPILFRYWIP